MKPSSHKDLETVIANNERRAEVSGLVVVVGLALELISAFAFRDKKPWIEYWSPILSDTVITLGVAGEILFARKASSAQAARQQLADEQIAETNERAAKAELAAADARERTAILEGFTAWRHVSEIEKDALKRAIGAWVKPFDFVIEYERGDPEAYAYSVEIASALKEAGFDTLRGTDNSWMSPGFFGLHLQMDLSFGDDSAAICEGFIETGMFRSINGVNLSERLTGRYIPVPRLYMIVAPKPPPAFGVPPIDPATRRAEMLDK